MSKQNLKIEVIETITLLQFYAEWCYPCKSMTTIIDEVQTNLDDWLNVFKIDVDSQRELAVKYQIRSVPKIIVLKENKEI